MSKLYDWIYGMSQAKREEVPEFLVAVFFMWTPYILAGVLLLAWIVKVLLG